MELRFLLPKRFSFFNVLSMLNIYKLTEIDEEELALDILSLRK